MSIYSIYYFTFWSSIQDFKSVDLHAYLRLLVQYKHGRIWGICFKRFKVFARHFLRHWWRARVILIARLSSFRKGKAVGVCSGSTKGTKLHKYWPFLPWQHCPRGQNIKKQPTHSPETGTLDQYRGRNQVNFHIFYSLSLHDHHSYFL